VDRLRLLDRRLVICAIRPDGTDLVTLFGDAAFPIWIG